MIQVKLPWRILNDTNKKTKRISKAILVGGARNKKKKKRGRRMICANPKCDNEVDVDNLDICSECFQEYFLDLKVYGQDPGQTSLEDFE